MKIAASIPSPVVSLLSIFFLLFVVSASEARDREFLLKQKKAVVTISINDRHGNVIVSGNGFIADRDGIIATNCKLIVKWLEDVGHSLIVKTEDGRSYEIDKLFVFNRRQDIALFEIKGGGLTAVEFSPDYSHAEYIKKQVAIYKKSAKAAKKETAPELQASVPAVSAPTLKPLPESNKVIIEKPAEIHKPGKKTTKIPDSAETLFLKGLKYEDSKKYADAAESYKKALSLKPDYSDAYVNLGVAYYKLGRYFEAADAYKSALQIRPDAVALYNKLGTIYMILGDHQKAIDSFEQALGVDSRDSAVHFNLGMVYFLTGNKDAALQQYMILNKLDQERAENLFEILYR